MSSKENKGRMENIRPSEQFGWLSLYERNTVQSGSNVIVTRIHGFEGRCNGLGSQAPPFGRLSKALDMCFSCPTHCLSGLGTHQACVLFAATIVFPKRHKQPTNQPASQPTNQPTNQTNKARNKQVTKQRNKETKKQRNKETKKQ